MEMLELSGTRIVPVAGVVLAVRAFRVTNTGVLESVGRSFRWADGENRAVCTSLDHRGSVPHLRCGCGFSGYGPTAPGPNSYLSDAQVWGVIECWGSIVATAQGVRAEKARIVGIWLPASVGEDVRQMVATRYRGAHLFRSREDLLRRYPPTRLHTYEPVPRRVGPSSGAGQRGIGTTVRIVPTLSQRVARGAVGAVTGVAILPGLESIVHVPPGAAWLLAAMSASAAALWPQEVRVDHPDREVDRRPDRDVDRRPRRE